MNFQRKKYPEENLQVPYFYKVASKVILKNEDSLQGIFRVRGKMGEVRVLKAKIEGDEPISEEEWCDIHVNCTLIKAFLRELPTPILEFKNYDVFMNIAGLNS